MPLSPSLPSTRFPLPSTHLNISATTEVVVWNTAHNRQLQCQVPHKTLLKNAPLNPTRDSRYGVPRQQRQQCQAGTKRTWTSTLDTANHPQNTPETARGKWGIAVSRSVEGDDHKQLRARAIPAASSSAPGICIIAHKLPLSTIEPHGIPHLSTPMTSAHGNDSTIYAATCPLTGSAVKHFSLLPCPIYSEK